MARVTEERGRHWHAEVVEVVEPSPDRVDSLCPIAGVDGAGCCDLAFVTPEAARRLKGDVVGNQLGRIGGHDWAGVAEEVGSAGPTGWRTRVRLDTTADGRAGFHRYHSSDLVTELACAQEPAAMLDGLDGSRWPPGSELHVALDDDGRRHVVQSGPRKSRTAATQVVEGDYEATQRVGERVWRVPVTAFWQAHRDAARVYSGLIAEWAQLSRGMSAWDLYGGAGVFAAVLADAVGESGHVLTVDTSRGSSRAARAALADLDSGLGGHRLRSPRARRAAAPRRRRGARSAAHRRRPRGHRPVGRRRRAADHPHRLRGRIIRARRRPLSAVTGTPSRSCGCSTRSR